MGLLDEVIVAVGGTPTQGNAVGGRPTQGNQTALAGSASPPRASWGPSPPAWCAAPR